MGTTAWTKVSGSQIWLAIRMPVFSSCALTWANSQRVIWRHEAGFLANIGEWMGRGPHASGVRS